MWTVGRLFQRASGSAFMGIMFWKTADVVVTGETRCYGSSSSGIRHFCPDYGSSLFFERASTALHGSLVGSLDEPSLFHPTMYICMSVRQPWLSLTDTLPKHEEKPEGMTPTGTYDSVTGRLVERS
jgi:hypothetical protein